MKLKFPYLPLLLLLLWSCNGKKSANDSTEQKVFDSRFANYIKAYTSGTISYKDNITIRFAETVTIPDNLSAKELFDIVPSLEGTIVKTAPHEITFSPTNQLKSGQHYSLNLKLSKLAEVPAELGEFEIRIQVIKQDYEISRSSLEARDLSKPNELTMSGTLTTADFVNNEAAEKVITIPNGLTLSWQHVSGTSHKFVIEGIKRAETPGELKLTIAGASIGVKRSEELKIEIPSTQVFSLLSTQINDGSDPHISLYFSDPLFKEQDLTGLIQIEGIKTTRTVIDGNEIKVYIPKNTSGTKKLEVSEGIRNANNKPLKQKSVSYLAFEPEKPQIRLISKGTILPSTHGLVLPFESVNLKSARVEVVQIFEDNMPQFFQGNDYDGNDGMSRVGRKIMEKRISLELEGTDLSAWNRYNIELSELFEAERGALYQFRISFRPEDTNYPCETSFSTSELPNEKDWNIYQNDGFDYWGNMWTYYYPNGYDWQQRENPCHVSYYRNRSIITSLLASDIGLIAKIGVDNSMHVFTTDMKTAQPVPAEITVLDYQLQELEIAQADPNGHVQLNPKRRPFLVVAKFQGQKSYLRLNDNTSLSMSNFDVSGERVKGSLKGFIYGERGVWRPGDEIFLSFMLEDPQDKIPSNHPIIMELRDPKGAISDRQVLTAGVNGLYTFRTNTPGDAITGYWNATISVGNTNFSKVVKVETIKPNRLKIMLDLGEERIKSSMSDVKANMDVNWLTGLKGSNIKVETELRLQATKTTFDGYAQYEFDDQAKSFYKDPKIIFSGTVDEAGHASFNTKLPIKPNSPGALSATFNTKAFEPGGGFSINSKSYTYLPYESFVGLNLTSAEGNRIKRDEKQTLQIISLDDSGQPVDKSGLDFKIYRLDWSWWWDNSGANANYLTSRYSQLIENRKVKTVGGKTTVDFEIKSPNWGRFVAVIKDPVSGHSASKVFYTSWYGGSEGNSLGASSLEVSTNKEEYKVGENVSVTIKGSLEGKALVTIENGSSVLENIWVDSDKEWTTFQIPATPEMAPNVYVHVTLLQPHGQTVNDLPIRLYGISSIKVFDPDTKLEPVIKMADELEPGGAVSITITERNQLPMSYTLAVVDEGLLDITNFTTPDPWNHFYSKEAIGVKTWDIYDDVVGAYGGRLERLISIGGGDGGLKDPDKMQENRFKPVVQFMGPFFIDAGGSKTHQFTMPQYIGSVKTMVVAGLNEAYGSTEKATPVVKPLMVLGTLPRVVGPGEKVSLPVNVFRYKEHIKNAEIKVEASGVLKITGTGKQSISLDKESGTLYFDLEVAEQIGMGKIKITATSGSELATHEINIAARSPNTQQTVTKLIPIKSGENVTLPVDFFGIEGSNEVALELASIPPINLDQRLKYLIRYPHGCVEQTVSSVFPQLYLNEVTELDNEQQIKVVNNIKIAIEKLSKFQISNGGMSYWPGATRYSSWGSNYAYHFLIEAQKKGHAVPSEMMNHLKNFQRNKAVQWTKSADRWDADFTQAYRLFTLAIGGNPELGAMNRLKNTSGKSYQTICKLAAAYAVIGQQSAAESLLKDAAVSLKEESYGYYYYSYGSYVRDLAIKLETYVYLDNQVEAIKVLQEISDRMSSGSWMSTQSTAYSLLAIGKYVTANSANEQMKADIQYGNTSTNWISEKAIYREQINAKNGDKLNIKNTGKANLFATLSITGIPKAGKEVIGEDNLDISVKVITNSGKTMRPDSIQLGESFEVIVSVKNTYPYGGVGDIALSQILPSGWEIQNDRLTDQQSNEYSSFDFQDIRDDRIYTYFYLKSNETKTFKVNVTAAYAGKYYMPGVHAEAMYKATINAKEKGKWVYVYQ